MTKRDHPTLGVRPGLRGTASWVIALSLVAAAAGVLVFSADTRLLRLGVVAALWAALISAFATARHRDRALAAEQWVTQQQRAYQRELEREIAARREFEAQSAAEVRREVAAEYDAELHESRAELSRLRANLRHVLGGDVLVERVASHPESRQLPDGVHQSTPYSQSVRAAETGEFPELPAAVGWSAPAGDQRSSSQSPAVPVPVAQAAVTRVPATRGRTRPGAADQHPEVDGSVESSRGGAESPRSEQRVWHTEQVSRQASPAFESAAARAEQAPGSAWVVPARQYASQAHGLAAAFRTTNGAGRRASSTPADSIQPDSIQSGFVQSAPARPVSAQVDINGNQPEGDDVPATGSAAGLGSSGSEARFPASGTGANRPAENALGPDRPDAAAQPDASAPEVPVPDTPVPGAPAPGTPDSGSSPSATYEGPPATDDGASDTADSDGAHTAGTSVTELLAAYGNSGRRAERRRRG